MDSRSSNTPMHSARMHRPEWGTNPRDLEEANVVGNQARIDTTRNNAVPLGPYPVNQGPVSNGSNVQVSEQSIKYGRQHHKDSLYRYIQVTEEDRNKDHYLNPENGKLALLGVQRAVGYQRDPRLTTTWSDPPKLSVLATVWKAYRETAMNTLTWTYNDILRQKAVLDGSLPPSDKLYSPYDIYWKYPIAALILTLTALLGDFEAKVYPNGSYAPVRYKYFSYPKVPRNKREAAEFESERNGEQLATFRTQGSVNRAPSNQLAPVPGQLDDADLDGVLVFKRHLRPRKLCVIRENHDAAQSAPVHIDVIDWDDWDEKGQYVFVSYTRKQFCTYSCEEIKGWEAPTTEEQRKIRRFQESNCDADRNQLLDIGIQAALDAGVKAFWIDVYCIPDAEAQMDSHRICDVARGSKCMVIALQDKVKSRAERRRPQTMDDLLRNWSARVWTLPEMLLAPTSYDLKIYHAQGKAIVTDIVPKRNMAARAYVGKDAMLVRQLVDHFEASQQLTLVELLTIGLECLVGRKYSERLRADPVYALMAMVRRRPIPNEEDTLFEAFAKLSLLNDSNSLLERLICILPHRRGEPWYKLEDFWGAKLWDIEPTVQVSAIAEDQTVILDGGFGATIHWNELNRVAFMKRETIWRSVAALIVRFAPIWLIIGCTLLASFGQPVPSFDGHKKLNPVIGVAIVFFLIAFGAVTTLPYAMLSLYSGKFWSTQAHLFGIEGQVDLEWLEFQLFGFTQGRLRWGQCGSTQSRHRRKLAAKGARWVDDEAESYEPKVKPLDDSGPLPTEPDRIFTIVDTYSLTVELIRAVHPPSVALICGHEGGMRRALLCSYDYRTSTFHRETVIRMPTKVLDRMDRVDKFRFSMTSMPLYTKKGGASQLASSDTDVASP